MSSEYLVSLPLNVCPSHGQLYGTEDEVSPAKVRQSHTRSVTDWLREIG